MAGPRVRTGEEGGACSRTVVAHSKRGSFTEMAGEGDPANRPLPKRCHRHQAFAARLAASARNRRITPPVASADRGRAWEEKGT